MLTRYAIYFVLKDVELGQFLLSLGLLSIMFSSYAQSFDLSGETTELRQHHAACDHLLCCSLEMEE